MSDNALKNVSQSFSIFGLKVFLTQALHYDSSSKMIFSMLVWAGLETISTVILQKKDSLNKQIGVDSKWWLYTEFLH